MILGHSQHWVETPYDTRALDFEPLTLSVEPAERIGAPLANRYKARLRRVFFSAVLLAGAWGAVSIFGLDGLIVSARSLYGVVVSEAEEVLARAHQARPETPASDAPERGAATPEAVPELTVTRDEQVASTDEPAATETMGAAYAEEAEPAADQDTSPKRKRAIEAGLGPDLPNVLLTRLSKADLENAAYAIKTALSKMPDDAAFSWPPKPSREDALFEIRFVQGAAEGCRRYIVTVTKDRWSSTSAALEACGRAGGQSAGMMPAGSTVASSSRTSR
ncbi:hypothetical protein [Hyphomicrobium sp.]|jgi:hypothetical protein|uniref:hypothetical protein n=1 Tax=Hyphomicrobium sp. TaxID=82 RepID=UPI002FE0771F